MWITSIEYQKRYNISPQLFYLWRTTGKLQTKELVKNHHLVWVEDEPSNNHRVVAVYGRVSTSKQKQDLSNQIDVLKKYVISNGSNPKVFSDIGSGMNEKRPGLISLMNEITQNKISKVVISHKDRLTRFGFGYLETIFKMYNTEIEIINLEDDKSSQEELTEDLIAIIHHFGMKFYGKRKNQVIDFSKQLKETKDK